MPSPNAGAGRSVTDMDHSWLTGAAALVIVLGPTATSSDASATAGTVGAPAATTARPALAMTTTAIGGNVIAVVPGAAITGDDHLPPKLDGSHTYRATFLMWVAPNARHPTLKVDAAGGVTPAATGTRSPNEDRSGRRVGAVARGTMFTVATREVRRAFVVDPRPSRDTRIMKRNDVLAVVNLRASMVAAQREYDELDLSPSVSEGGEVPSLDAHEEFVIRRFAAISLRYHQAVHRYYGLADRLPVAGQPTPDVLDLELVRS